MASGMGVFEDIFCGPRCLARMTGMGAALGASCVCMRVRRVAVAVMSEIN